MSLQHLMYGLAHKFNGGLVALAAVMNKNDRVLNQKVNPNNTTHFLTLEEFETIADFTNGNLKVAEYFANKENAVVYVMPDLSGNDEEALLDSFVGITQKLGELSAEFLNSYADGQITNKELSKLFAEINKVEQALLVHKETLKRIAK